MAEGKKILLVEDNDFVRMQLGAFLQEAGYAVQECSEGGEALAALDADTDLAVVDVRMEPVDGFEFVKAVRSQKRSDMPIILVTGDQNPDLLSEASKWRVAAVLMKPVKKDRLLKSVERAMRVKE